MPYTFEYDELAALVTGNDPVDEDFDAEEAICEKFEIDFIEQFMPLVDALTAYTAPLETALSGDVVQGFMRFDEVGPRAIIRVDAEGDAAKYPMNRAAPFWTTKPPVVAGFYWVRVPNEEPAVLEVFRDPDHMSIQRPDGWVVPLQEFIQDETELGMEPLSFLAPCKCRNDNSARCSPFDQ